jgi:hypothetical protein
MELRGAELPREDGAETGVNEPAQQETGEAEAARQETAAKEAEGPVRKPDLLLPPASDKKDIRPSDGWSFGTFSDVPPEQVTETEEAQQPEEAPDEEQEQSRS